MKVKAFIEKGLDGTFDITFGENNTLPFGVVGTGKTVEDAMQDFNGSIEDMREYYAEVGKAFPIIELEFCYEVQPFLQYYSTRFSLAGLEVITGINQRQLSHYLTGHRNPSETTIRKIEASIYKFASELSNVNF